MSTDNAHIAMFSIAAHGHVNPNLDVIRELVARGHRVTYAIPESFAEIVAATGAEPVIYGSTLPDAGDPEAWGSGQLDYMERFFDDAVQALPQLAEAYEGDAPDLVLADSTSYPARILAHGWGVPVIQLSTHMVAWQGSEDSPVAQQFEEIKRSERGRAYYDRFAAWLAGNGVTMDHDRFVGHPDRCLALIPRAMQPYADLVDESVYTFTGPCQGDRSEQGTWERPVDAEKVLLVSLGSTFNKQPEFYRECIKAFGDLAGWHVVLQIGKQMEVAELGDIPPNFEVHHWIPQLAILRQADVFVTHAGMGGSQEGLACGVPMVAVPQAVDQFGNAAILEELGVARHVPAESATAEVLREAVLSLAGDPGVAARCAELKAELAAEGGTPRAADLIEAELRSRG